MKRAPMLVAGAVAGVLALTAGPASAFDCIRVSSSPTGLEHSTGSGNWMAFTIRDLADGAVADGEITPAQADCAVAAWQQAGEPSYFAIGVGVAGARGATQSGRITDQDFYELAKNAPAKVMVNGTGVDHLDDALAMFVFPACVGG